MAATISDAGNGAGGTPAAATIATGATVTASIGDWLVVIVASSNSGASGAESQNGVVDGDGVNTYTERALILYNPDNLSTGATLGIYTCEVTSALSGDTVTANFSPNTAERTIQVYRVQPGAGEAISLIAVDTTGSTGEVTTHSAATVAVTSGDIIFGCGAIETDDTVTGDSDTTNGNWSSLLRRLADSGQDAASMSNATQYKTTTGTGEQSWAATTSNSRRSARTYIVLRSAAAAKSLVADGGSYSISGTAASLEIGREVVADAGSYAISGTDASTELGRKVAADAGSYAITGTAATLRHAWVAVADGGTYAIAGTDAALNKGKTLAADGGSYAVSGTAASLLHALKIAAGGGTYTVSGTDVALNLGQRLTAAGGSYTISGSDADLLLGQFLAAASGSYAITGTAADALRGLHLAANGGNYTITGAAAEALLDHILTAAGGSYAITGQSIDLVLAAGGGASGGEYHTLIARRRRRR